MHFKSVRTLIATLVGGCILLVAAGLVIYSVIANARSQALVESQTKELLESNIEARLTAIASAQTEEIKGKLEHALTLATSLANTSAMLGKENENGRPLMSMSRRELSMLVRQTVVDNSVLLDAFIGWEPNAFGNDARYIGREDEGYGPDGRFMPWWYRTGSGAIEVLPLGSDMESQDRGDNGIRQGEYYLCPRETKRSCVVDPHLYDYNGEILLVTSFNAPILVDGEFRGSAGVDLSVEFIQGLLEEANQSLYNGAGEIALIASQGALSAYTSSPDLLGQNVANVLDADLQTGIAQAQQGEKVRRLHTEQGMTELYWPFSIGDSGSSWVLMIRLPNSAVLAGLHDLQGQMESQRETTTLGMIGMGLTIAFLGLIASWLLGSSISRPLKQLADRMREIASGDGDLTQRLPVYGRNEGAELAIQFNAFAVKIHDVLVDVRTSSESVHHASNEIAMGGQDLSRRTDNAAASLQQTSASIEEITSTVEHTAASAKEANKLSQTASEVAHEGGKMVANVVTTMEDITQASDKIGEIVTLMNGIAFQTNLLALNASVEAARAGEHGRGFAVVADEVRKLAGRSSDAANDIQKLIEDSQSKVNNGTTLVRNAGATMQDIVAHITRVTDVLEEINAATSEQSDGIRQVNIAVAELDRMTQANAAMVEESTTAAEQLKEQADHLAVTIGSFKLAAAHHPHAPRARLGQPSSETF